MSVCAGREGGQRAGNRAGKRTAFPQLNPKTGREGALSLHDDLMRAHTPRRAQPVHTKVPALPALPALRPIRGLR